MPQTGVGIVTGQSGRVSRRKSYFSRDTKGGQELSRPRQRVISGGSGVAPSELEGNTVQGRPLSQAGCVQIPALLLTSCVILDRLTDLSVPQFFHL